MRLSFEEIKKLIVSNNKSSAFTTECVIAVSWKESSFNPQAQSSSSSAKGLMQMTDGAVDTVNATTPSGIHFEHADMLIAAKAIQCGTYYLQWCSDQSGGGESSALNKYGGVAGYSTDVIAAEACLLTGLGTPANCLKGIHSFELQRTEMKLLDDPSGHSRFKKPHD